MSSSPQQPLWLVIRILAVGFYTITLGCGGQSTDNPSNSQHLNEGQAPITILSVSARRDDAPVGVYLHTEVSDELVIDAGLVAESWLTLTVVLEGDRSTGKCWLGKTQLEKQTLGKIQLKEQPESSLSDRLQSFSVRIQPAYFDEQLMLNCSDGVTTKSRMIRLKATDPELISYIDSYVDERIPRENNNQPEDPYSGYRRNSYYSAIYTFLSASEMYLNPEAYGIDPGSAQYRQIELFLINGAEAYFEPCVDYDVFASFPSRQCRSRDRVGEYYVWRSAEARDRIRTDHAKTEWRGAGGIAQAVKAILLKTPKSDITSCPVSDEPSLIKNVSLFCRAINVRRLLYKEVWRKHSRGIERTDVPHYIAWTELIVDLFQSTADVAPDLHCIDCPLDESLDDVTSQMNDVLRHFSVSPDGFVNMNCRPPGSTRPCVWTSYDFSHSESTEIGHQDVTIHLLTRNDEDRFCAGDAGHCVDLNALAQTFSKRTWVDSEKGGDATGFPKFDIFLNGYCSQNYKIYSSALQDFCWNFWYSESSNWPAHRKLFGWVNLGRYDRELMIKLRIGADENHDGLLNRDDVYLRTFAVFLFRAEKQINYDTP